jgi:hypothetical protein
MRIAILFHENHDPRRVEGQYAIGLYAQQWRCEGHEVRFLLGCKEFWPADLAILHVDRTVVPTAYRDFARRFPRVLNDRIVDIRKSVLSPNLVQPGDDYAGPVIVKNNLNADGFPERFLSAPPGGNGPWGGGALWKRLGRRAAKLLPGHRHTTLLAKAYQVYNSPGEVPRGIWESPDQVVEKFLPERDGEWYITRRCGIMGSRAISYRMADKHFIVDSGDSKEFAWIENAPEVVEFARQVGLDYGVIDYTVHDGQTVVFDVNKTPGQAPLRIESVRDSYARLVGHNWPGLYDFVRNAGTRGA